MRRDTGSSPQVDEEGVWRWFYDKPEEELHLTKHGSIIRNVRIATALNVRRAIREQVGQRLAAFETAAADMKSQLSRIEQKLDSLLSTEKRPLQTGAPK
jgi:hypothetical protein